MERLQTQFIDLPDARLAYCEHGTGPHLILLHGNSESKRIFSQYQLDDFNMFTTMAVDSRGHGETQSRDVELTIEKFSEDVIEFCGRKGIKKAFVIGYSDGGNIALFLAKKAPGLFPRIVAISPNTLASGTEPGTLRLFTNIQRLMIFLKRLGFDTKKAIMRLNLMLTDIGLSDADLAGIQTSVKIVYAEKDLIKEEHIQHITSLIPGATLDEISGCNHMNVYKKPAAIQLMKNYLSSPS
jgi:pimeloyl-ACP methyl ester carboxylesterase